ncbi:hypothetical protein DM02DRAFT_540057 [Periconia macrospinosa]|uniref:F-box domain-containing protein n=1 Tax=Periconia macrospinosa TaxID=97972 RepID=A0A2V1D7R6_9PLEO|nr:hypothetical protein DM02DRAFT_540057 [Periconia macrospinosa]
MGELEVERSIPAEVAERVLLKILQTVETLDDLFSCAVVNRGFYRVFKRNELDLIKRTLWTMSPPAWEYREICYELDLPKEEYTVASYLQNYEKDLTTICSIKGLIKENSQASIPLSIIDAAGSEDPEDCRRVEDALWRIETFCKISASRKSGIQMLSETDMTAHIDWLQGGILASLSKTDDNVSVDEPLKRVPTFFGKGNSDLTIEKLMDMLNLWTCVGKIFPTAEGNINLARDINLARSYGIFDRFGLGEHDMDGHGKILGKGLHKNDLLIVF